MDINIVWIFQREKKSKRTTERMKNREEKQRMSQLRCAYWIFAGAFKKIPRAPLNALKLPHNKLNRKRFSNFRKNEEKKRNESNGNM